jgi:hypothetical protein
LLFIALIFCPWIHEIGWRKEEEEKGRKWSEGDGKLGGYGREE